MSDITKSVGHDHRTYDNFLFAISRWRP